jgi:hypothetical protein
MNETDHQQTAAMVCSDRVRFTQAFLQAIRELGVLQTEQARAVIEGDPEFSRFDLLIHMANQKKDDAKYALLLHIDQHHC